MLGELHSYVLCASVFWGILEFPGTTARGVGAIDNARVLRSADGLPAGSITAIAGSPQKMWVGFSGSGGSGLGLYNAETGAWKTAFSNMEKGSGPLRSGDSYGIGSLILWSGSAFFSARSGLWEYHPGSGEAHLLGNFTADHYSGNADGFYLWEDNSILHVDPRQKECRYELASRMTLNDPALRIEPPWRLEKSGLPPVDPHQWDIDFVTAAFHGDRLWARCGKTGIIIVQRGQKVEDGTKIPNDILDGGPVLQFFDTPYGLLAVGQGSAGIIEDQAGE